jgi:hypothetical protein
LTEADLEAYIRLLVERPAVRALWEVKDRGMPVFAHSIDVALLALDVFPRWRERHPSLDLDSIVIGSVVHDLTKSGSIHHSDRSHTRIMNDEPSLAVNAAVAVIDEVTAAGGHNLSRECLESVRHIVASHHGYWGKVPPRTPEALLVHRCDYYSATHHRMVPIDTNDILPLLVGGNSWPRVSAKLGVSRDTVKTRLQESCRAERVRDWPDLVPIWRARGSVSVGTPERQNQLDRVRLLIQLSGDAPRTLMTAIRPLLSPASRSRRLSDDEPLMASVSLWESEIG